MKRVIKQIRLSLIVDAADMEELQEVTEQASGEQSPA